MSEHHEGTAPSSGPAGDVAGTPIPTAAPSQPSTASSSQPSSQPSSAAPTTPGPDAAPSPSSDETPQAAHEEAPDALGVVEEQERVPETESTIAEPGEALEELLPALAATGHEGVDDALATLDDMAATSVHDHVEVFDAVHEELRRTLDQAAAHE